MSNIEDKKDGVSRGYHHFSRAWYGRYPALQDHVDSIMLGYYASEGGTTGECQIRWEHLGGAIVPRLLVFDDAWWLLTDFADLFAHMALADNKNRTPDQVRDMLDACGFKDMTAVARPEGY